MIRFLSNNDHKIAEVRTILGSFGIDVAPLRAKVSEIQTVDMQVIARDKCLRAYDIAGRPVLVEHTGLRLDGLKGLPGGLTQVFWDTLEADTFSKLFGVGEATGVVAETVVAFCDGRTIATFDGAIRGTIASSPRGSRDFQWDCVFVPEGSEQTFAEMGDKKNSISMRKVALEKFAKAHVALRKDR